MQHWKKFVPAWGFVFAWGLTAPLLATSRFYEEHPKIAWPIVLSVLFFGGLYMIFLRGVMLRILLDKSMSTTTRNFLWIAPSMMLCMLGAAVGTVLKRIFI